MPSTSRLVVPGESTVYHNEPDSTSRFADKRCREGLLSKIAETFEQSVFC